MLRTYKIDSLKSKIMVCNGERAFAFFFSLLLIYEKHAWFSVNWINLFIILGKLSKVTDPPNECNYYSKKSNLKKSDIDLYPKHTSLSVWLYCMNTNANLHCFEQITFNKWNWEQIIMETAEFTIFNNKLRFHFSDQNLLDLTLGSRGFFFLNAASPRTVSVDKKKISSGTQGS